MKNQTSWKTTIGGLLAAVGTALSASSNPNAHATGTILSGIGVLVMGASARDNDKTSEDVGADLK